MEQRAVFLTPEELNALLDANYLPYSVAALEDDEEFEMMKENNPELANAQRKLVEAAERFEDEG